MRLTVGQEQWLLKLWENQNSGIDRLQHIPKPPKSVLNKLAEFGYAENTQNEKWKITEKGLERCKQIY